MAVIAELRVARERVDVVPEDVEELLVADRARVVDDLDRFGVTRATRRDLLVRGILGLAAGVADRRRDHPRELLEGRLHAPETATSEGRSGARRGLVRPGWEPADQDERAQQNEATPGCRRHPLPQMPTVPGRLPRRSSP